ncbi:MAG: hypothetical protein JXM79_08560, partial [Sedimentisphaerales bacterium]|nr:hypothetical protein [Sedimentisphaerales bacterium]
HLVYFGTDLSPPLISLVSNQTITEHHPKMEFDPGPLDLDTMYFWRIDEVNGTDRTIGALWSFTTASSQPKGRTCFTGETGIWVDGMLMPISVVSVGKCIELPAKSLLPSLGRIQELQEHEGIFECYDIVLESGNRIAVAENHFFLAESGQWIALQNLTDGMRLQTPNGSVGIVGVIKRATPYIGKVYNLLIEGSDRYLVGKDAIIVRDY